MKIKMLSLYNLQYRQRVNVSKRFIKIGSLIFNVIFVFLKY